MSKGIFSFDFQTSIKRVEETKNQSAIVEGTLLVEGLSRNGNIYSIDEMKSIAQKAVGKPVFFGVTTKINENTGLLAKNLHDNSQENRIGKILKTIWSKRNRVVTFVAEVFNTAKFPDLIQKLKSGWGVSIGGYVLDAIRRFSQKFGRNVLNIKDMVVEHLQIVPPSVTRGQDAAKVESVKITETMSFTAKNQLLTTQQITAILVGVGLI